MSASTQLSNGTKHGMKVLVGTGSHASELATVEAGGKYVIGVDYNATYREYTVGIDAAGMEKFIVSTDDLCDNKCITIKEESDCKLKMLKEPRQSCTTTTAEVPTKSEKSTAGYVGGCPSRRAALFTSSTVSRNSSAEILRLQCLCPS